ncbi:hypothetical protein BHE74_00050864 [Ensete ventricosum]|nr:hypothetical protein BHE74_00050864 [Ensete ventricosum]
MAAARDRDTPPESFPSPSRSRVVQYSTWDTDGSRRYTTAPSHGDPTRSSSSSPPPMSSILAPKSVVSEAANDEAFTGTRVLLRVNPVGTEKGLEIRWGKNGVGIGMERHGQVLGIGG